MFKKYFEWCCSMWDKFFKKRHKEREEEEKKDVCDE